MQIIFFIFQYLMGMKSAPLSKVASLNLTGSLSNVDYPMDLIKFSTMFQLVTIKQYFFVWGEINVVRVFIPRRSSSWARTPSWAGGRGSSRTAPSCQCWGWPGTGTTSTSQRPWWRTSEVLAYLFFKKSRKQNRPFWHCLVAFHLSYFCSSAKE